MNRALPALPTAAKEEPTMTTIDVPRLRKVLEHATAHPEEHDQRFWVRRTACGTVCCIAGRVVIDAHGVDKISFSVLDDSAWAVEVNGSLVYIAVEAGVLLGLTSEQVDELFHRVNTLGDLWRIAYRITGGAIEVPLHVRADTGIFPGIFSRSPG